MTYPFDSTGTAASNLVVGEQKPVKTLGLGTSLYMFLANALFYTRGFVVQYTVAGGTTRTLTKGIDYSFEYLIDGVIAENPIYAAVKIENQKLNGTLTFSYHAVGGNWLINKPHLIQYQRENTFNPRLAYLAVVPYPPLMDVDGVTPIELNSLESLQYVQTLANPVGLSIGIRELDSTQKILSNGLLLVDGDETPENLTGSMPSGGNTVSVTGNVAQEAGGNLDQITGFVRTTSTVQGTPADAPWTGSGNSSVVSLLKAIASAFTGSNSVNTRHLDAASDSISVSSSASTPMHVDGSAVVQPVSASSLPLPTGAAKETGGNLSAISANTASSASAASTIAANTSNAATQLTALNEAHGTTSDAAWSGTGASGVIGVLKAIYAKLAGVLNTRALSKTTDSVTATIDGSVSVMSTQLPESLGQKTSANSASVTIASDQPAINVSSTAGSLALDSSIQSLISAVKATVTMDGTIWVDASTPTPIYYIRRETYIQQAGAYAVTWENLDGSQASPVVSNLREAASIQGLINEQLVYTATATGTGYASGDMLIHAYGLNTTTVPPSLAYAFWFNMGPSVSSGTVLSTAPTGGSYTTAQQTLVAEQSDASKLNATVTVASSVLPTNAAQEAGGNLSAIASALSGAGSVNIGNGTTNATIRPLSNSNALNVALVDSSGNQMTSLSAPSNPLDRNSYGYSKTLPDTLVYTRKMNAGTWNNDFTVDAGPTGSPYAQGYNPILNDYVGVTVSSGTTALASQKAKSNFSISTIPGQGALVRIGYQLQNPTQVGYTREWGRRDEYDGYAIRAVDGVMYLVIASSGTETLIPSTSWSVPQTIDSNPHDWAFETLWYGAGSLKLYLDQLLVHTYDYRDGLNGGVGPRSSDLPIYFVNTTTQIGLPDAPSVIYTVSVSTEGSFQTYLDALTGDEPAIAVAISPNTPVTIDSSKPVNVGAVVNGAVTSLKLGADGGLILSEKGVPIPYSLQRANESLVIDCAGYAQLILQATGTWSGTFTFSWSVDGTSYVLAGIGVSVQGQNNSSTITANGTYAYPVMARYFKITFTTATSGSMYPVVTLKSTPLAAATLMNITHINGTGVANVDGVNNTGRLPVGGTSAYGATSTAYGLRTAYTDYAGLLRSPTSDAVGNTLVAGAVQLGYKYGSFNFSLYPWSTSLSTQTRAQSTPAPVLIGGVDDASNAVLLKTLPDGSIRAAPAVSNNSDRSIAELLAEQQAYDRVNSYYLYKIMILLRGGIESPAEEPDVLFNDMYDQVMQYKR